MNDMNLKGKTALVTAATRGIGWAIACSLAERGACVYISSTANELKAAKDKVNGRNKQGYSIRMIEYDAFDEATYQPMLDMAAAESGHLDILVNNFGYTDIKKDLNIEHIQYADFESIVNLNLRNVIRPIQMAIPYMKEYGGSIVNISSISGKIPDMSELAYSTAKAAICYLTRMIAVQEASNGIRCNAILPGIVETDAVKSALTPEFKQFFLRHVPAGRMAQPEEIGETAAYLVSNPYITGQLVEVAGGFGIGTPLYADIQNMEKGDFDYGMGK